MFCCCPPKDDYRNCCCCMPLSLAAIFLTLLIGWWGAWEIAGAVLATSFPDFGTVVHLVVGCLYCLATLLGLLGVCLRNKCMTNFMLHGWNSIIGISIVFFIYSWIVWGLWFGGIGTENDEKWEPNADEITTMVVTSVFTVTIVGSGWWILGVFKSLAAVFAVGGNGWELKNSQDIREEENGSDKS